MATSEAQKRAVIKYEKNNLKRVPFNVTLAQYDELKAYADKHNMSISRLIKDAITKDTGINFYK